MTALFAMPALKYILLKQQNHRLLDLEYVGSKIALKKMMCKLGTELIRQYNENKERNFIYACLRGEYSGVD